MAISRRTWLAATGAGGAVTAAGLWAQQRPGGPAEPPKVSQELQDGLRIITTNGVPEHPTGDFPNRHDPVPLRPQQFRL